MAFLYITNHATFTKACEFYSNQKSLALDTETTELYPWKGDLSLIQLKGGGKTVVIDVFALLEEAGIPHRDTFKNGGIYKDAWHIFEPLKKILEDPDIIKVIHNADFEHKWLQAKCGIFCQNVFDTFLASILIYANPENDPKKAHNLAAVALRNVKKNLDKTEQRSDWSVRPLSQDQLDYAALDVEDLEEIREVQYSDLLRRQLLRVANIEFDVVGIVASIELYGLKVNREEYEKEIKVLEALREIAQKALQAKVKEENMVQESLFGLPEKDYGEVLLTSSAQMKAVLNKMDIPIFSKTELEMFELYKKEENFIKQLNIVDQLQVMKERYPKFDHTLYANYRKNLKEGKTLIQGTGAKALQAMDKTEYDVLGNLKEFRGTEKLVSSYGQNFLDHLIWHGEQHERVHTDYRQIGAPTGRFSSKNPNTQQIPAGEIEIDGQKHEVAFRKAFDFPKGRTGINADYSQIELRIAAEMSRDKAMLDTFHSGRDLHADTASKVFGVEYELCAQEGHKYYKTYRKYSKSINFGIVYGMGADALALQIGVSKEEAQEMIDKYNLAYPTLWAWLKKQKFAAIKNLKAYTLSGRIQDFLPADKDEFGEPIKWQLSAIGRNGMNMPIQGTGADILKRAMKIIHDRLAPYDAFIVNIVHDEVTVETAQDENLETVRKIVEDSMIDAAREFLFKVPVKVDAHIINNWGDK